MSQPARTIFSFGSWDQDHPGERPPGDRLDAQFQELIRGQRVLAERIDTLLRSDGLLRNGIVTRDTLASDIADDLARNFRRQVEPELVSASSASLVAEAASRAATVSREGAERAAVSASSAASVVADARQAALHALLRLREEVEARLIALQNASDVVDNYANDASYFANLASKYCELAGEWAEHMPDTIPPNTLAVMNISGSHWSSRWWAMQSANAFGMLAWWYMGAFPSPGPPTTPLTPTGAPIPPGSMYFDTTLGVMMVWNGSTWVNAYTPGKATTASLYYLSAAGQTVFPLATTDRNGKTFAFNQTSPEGVQAFVNGVRLEPVYDFTVDTVASTITFLRPLTLNALAIFDILTPTSQLTPSGTVNTVLVSPIVPDGTKVTFTGLTVAMNGHPVNVAKNEELQVSVNGVVQQPGVAYNANAATITFSQAPEADAVVFITWFGPANP